jgi:uncharacterized protein
MEISNRKDILLLLLYSPGKNKDFNEPIVGRTRLIKLLYIFKKEALRHFKKNTKITEENFYEFFPWDFGPFSSQVYDDLMFFELRNFIEAKDSEDDALPESALEWANWADSSVIGQESEGVSEYEEEQFHLTDEGKLFTEKKLYNNLSDHQKNLLIEFKSKFASTPLRAILRYVYKTYPDDTVKSKIKNNIF